MIFNDIGTLRPQGKPFALNMVVRHPVTGEPMKMKYIEANDGNELHDEWIKNIGVPKRKKRAAHIDVDTAE